MKALKPCPFCGNTGSDEDPLRVAQQNHSWTGASWSVQCDKCNACMGYSKSSDEAVEDWNRRAVVPALEVLPTLAETAQAAAVIARCNGYDLDVWTEGEWPDDTYAIACSAIVRAAEAALASPQADAGERE